MFSIGALIEVNEFKGIIDLTIGVSNKDGSNYTPLVIKSGDAYFKRVDEVTLERII